MTTALMDMDSAYYILAWQFRDRVAIPEEAIRSAIMPSSDLAMEMYGAVDQFIIGILQACGATHYLGAIGDKEKCFRYRVAKFKPYKSGRKSPEPWFTLWKPIIEERFRTEWGLVSVPGLEADDIISGLHEKCEDHVIICSPDKDLRQCPGRFFDYKKIDFADVDAAQADYNFCFQMIAGDTGDNVAGIPGAGAKKAAEKLKEGKIAGLFYDQVVRSMYYKHFGEYYGNIIYLENHAVLSMMTSKHPYYDDFHEQLSNLRLRPVPTEAAGEATTEKLKALGWG